MVKIINLMANYEKNPIGLTKAPMLQWQIENDEKFVQKYFRIKISSCENGEQVEVFDSGNVESEVMFFNCENVALKPFNRYFWSVEVENEKNGEKTVSDICEFVTSVLNRSQWTADIFRKFECIDVLSERKIFEIKENVKKAYIFVAASGEKSNGYNVYINGKRVSKDLLMPGPMEYMAMRVRGYDVTEYLKEKNVVNIDHLSALSVVLKIFTDNGEQIIQTDSNWEGYLYESPFLLGYENCYTPTRHHGKYELFDATKRNSDWYNENYSFENVNPAPIRNWGPIKLRYLPTTAIVAETLFPVSITKSEGNFLVDFGKIQSGYVELVMHNQKNKIKIEYAEKIIDGKLCFTQYASEYLPVNEYVPLGLDNEIYSPYFMHTSFRYVMITGLEADLSGSDVRALFIHSDVDGKSRFKTDDSELEYVYKCIQRSYKSNLVHIPTDCPGRERRGWTGDSYAVIDSQCFMYNVYNLYDRWLEDLHDNQRMNGWCTVEYPDQTDPCIDLNWPMHIIIVPWTIYEHYGNIEILQKNIDSMEKYCELLYELSDEYLFAENLFMYGDWVATDRATSGFIGASMFCFVNKLLSCAEKELGKFDLAKKYSDRAEEIKKAINNKYLVNGEGFAYYDKNSQSANTLALMFDICPRDKEILVLNSLVNDIKKKNAVTLGFIANTWFFRVLSKYNQDELAYRLITDDTFEISLAKMVNMFKNETLNEGFDDVENSFNHAFLGGGASTWIYRCYAGIDIIKPGYKEFSLKPYFSQKTNNFFISTNTPYGVLKLSWKRTDLKIDVKVVCPNFAKGTIILQDNKYNLKFGENKFSFIEK